jgi:hypothetical protein
MTKSQKRPEDREPEPAAAPAPKRGRGMPPQRHAEAHDDNVLESLGKAVSEPVRDAADPDADEKPA